MGNNTNGNKGKSDGFSMDTDDLSDKKTLKELNNEAVESYKELADLNEVGKEKLDILLKYCNDNDLEIIDPKLTTNDVQLQQLFVKGKLSALAIHDPVSGRRFLFEDTVLNIEDKMYEPSGLFMPKDKLKDNFDKLLKETREVVKNTDPLFMDSIMNIKIAQNKGSLGYYNADDWSSITVTPSAFLDNKQWETGLTGTIVHESMHNWEAYNYDYAGALKDYAGLKTFPTKYGFTRYENGSRSECITTVAEQVYTKTLRNDALMKNGKEVAIDFYSKYNRVPSEEEAYEYWAEDWKDLVDGVDKIMFKTEEAHKRWSYPQD